MKKILSIFGILILIGLLVFGAWYLFFRDQNSSTSNPFEDLTNTFNTFFDSEIKTENTFNGDYGDLEPTELTRETKMPILRQISSEPIAGYTFFTKEFEELEEVECVENEECPEPETKKVDKYIFRFIERTNGHISETNEDTLTVTKTTNQTTQKIYNAIFSNNGNKIVFEKLNNFNEGIDSFVGEIVEKEEVVEEEEEPVKSTSLEIKPFSILTNKIINSKDKNYFAYIISTVSTSKIYLKDYKTETEKMITELPLRDLNIEWGDNNHILATTKPSSGESGYSYLINTNGTYRKILGDLPGLTTKINGVGDKVLFSTSSNNEIGLGLLDLETGEEVYFSISTLPEKCVFSNIDEDIIYCAAPNYISQNKMPDDWYKGKVSFDDFIWRIDLEENKIDSIYSFNVLKYGSFDLINLELTNKDEYLLFENKKDLTLWSLNLKELFETGSTGF